MISEEKTNVTYFPTRLENQENKNGNQSALHTKSTQLLKLDALRLLHECVEHCLRSWYQISVREFSFATKYRQKIQLYLHVYNFVLQKSSKPITPFDSISSQMKQNLIGLFLTFHIEITLYAQNLSKADTLIVLE